MISRFFLARPVLSAVVSILFVFLGAMSFRQLPIQDYPQIIPPQILVTASFPGATAQTMADSVASPLEAAVNGAEDMIYMFSQSAAPGNYNLNITFEVGTDLEVALNSVRNRVHLALPMLPEEVRKQGVSATKQLPEILLFIAVESPEGIYDDQFISNYVSINIVNEMQRIKGVSSALVLNAMDYSMRIWLNPDQIRQFDLTISDVLGAIKEQNAIRSIGEIGQTPTASSTQLTIPVNSSGRLKDPKAFEEIVLRANANGAPLLLRDVGRVELGAQDYSVVGRLNGKKGTYLAIYQDPDSNAISVGNSVKQKMEELSHQFPSGLVYSIPYNTVDYVKHSIWHIGETFLIAAFLVSLVIFVFLHSFRATLIPVIAMVVSMVGTFAGMYLLGFSINTLSAFGMVLAIGIVVDDAIIVVENIEHNMSHFGLSSLEAATKTMKNLTGPVIAISLALCAVFVPIAFMGSIPGQFYRQFAITISISVVISAFVALSLTPVLAVILFNGRKEPSRFTQKFNELFDQIGDRYIAGARRLLDKPLLGLGIWGAILAAIVALIFILPLGFVPEEDQGLIFVAAELPDGASLNRVSEVGAQIEAIALQTPGVENILGFSGYSLVESISRTQVGAYFITLKNWSERKEKSLRASALMDRLNQQFAQIPEANIFAFGPAPIPGLGFTGGFDFWILNQEDIDMSVLNDAVDRIVARATGQPEFEFFITSIRANCLELFLDVNTVKASALDVDIEDVYKTLQVLIGSNYINDFNKFGRTFQVIAQAEPSFREKITDIDTLYVRSRSNQMVPLKAIVSPRFSSAPTLVSRFNDTPAALISVIPADIDPDRVISKMEEIAKEELPPGMSFSWGGLAYEQKKTGGPSRLAVLGAFIMMFLLLAALYERWTLPIIILSIVPFAVFGALVAIWIRGFPDDIYFQIAIFALIGVSAKNSILIVEFARLKRSEGMGIAESALEAARLRFRAIIMTSVTLIFGVLPLALSSGVGAMSRQSVGTAVVGGMFFATFLAIFFVPLFFQLIEQMVERRTIKRNAKK